MARPPHQTGGFSFYPVITCQCFPNAEKTYQNKHHAVIQNGLSANFCCISIEIWNGYPFHWIIKDKKKNTVTPVTNKITSDHGV